jgi:hypothetical protein
VSILGGNGQAHAVASMSACRFAFDCDADGFACSKTLGMSIFSLSISHECHHPDSFNLQMGKREATNTSEYRGGLLPVEVMFVSVFPRLCAAKNENWQKLRMGGQAPGRACTSLTNCIIEATLLLDLEED